MIRGEVYHGEILDVTETQADTTPSDSVNEGVLSPVASHAVERYEHLSQELLLLFEQQGVLRAEIGAYEWQEQRFLNRALQGLHPILRSHGDALKGMSRDADVLGSLPVWLQDRLKRTGLNFRSATEESTRQRRILRSFATLPPAELDEVLKELSWLCELRSALLKRVWTDAIDHLVSRLDTDNLKSLVHEHTPEQLSAMHDSIEKLSALEPFLRERWSTNAPLAEGEQVNMMVLAGTVAKVHLNHLAALQPSPQARTLRDSQYRHDPAVQRSYLVQAVWATYFIGDSTEKEQTGVRSFQDYLYFIRGNRERYVNLKEAEVRTGAKIRVTSSHLGEIRQLVRSSPLTLADLDRIALLKSVSTSQALDHQLGLSAEILRGYCADPKRLESQAWRDHWAADILDQVVTVLNQIGYSPSEQKEYLREGEPALPLDLEPRAGRLSERADWLRMILGEAEQTLAGTPTVDILQTTLQQIGSRFPEVVARQLSSPSGTFDRRLERIGRSFAQSIQHALDQRYGIRTLEPLPPLIEPIPPRKGRTIPPRVRQRHGSFDTLDSLPNLESAAESQGKLPFQFMIYSSGFNPLGSAERELAKVQSALALCEVQTHNADQEEVLDVGAIDAGAFSQLVGSYLRSNLASERHARNVNGTLLARKLWDVMSNTSKLRWFREYKRANKRGDQAMFCNAIHVPGSRGSLYLNVGLIPLNEDRTGCLWNITRTEDTQRL